MGDKIDKLKEKASELPQHPGVYMMRDSDGEVIYIGKAARLKNRVQSYFRSSGEIQSLHDVKTEHMVSNIDDFDVTIVDSEFEALLLENSLIKEYQPKYNIRLRDDKGYPYIRVDIASAYPMFKIVSFASDDNALYLGPYGGRGDTRRAVSEVCKALKLPTCSKNIGRSIGKERPCLNHDMGNCRGYCQTSELAGDYKSTVLAAIDVFGGKTRTLIKKLTREMQEESENLRFEAAAILRDRIKAIRIIEQKQFFVEEPVEEIDALQREKVLKTHLWLEKALRLDKTPERIEAYDISNTGDSDIVGSMTVFFRGKPLKKDYRRFKIKAKKRQDDYGSMAEVVTRRIKRYLAGDEKFSTLPDLMLIDGGANHASRVKKTIMQLGVDIPVFGMVKDEKHRTRELCTPDGEGVGLAANPAVFALIGTIQEETHRFAVEYHRNLRSKSMLEGKAK
ncbi:MAG: excinuclease ABC subunit UvrC [Oscillospiraceae bacterium]|nr:excinuclease ABC subunit UvrC [Oscillospiraceae bacterium]MCL2277850.1 excinuclease ABC subunit UvrC [Oscillospiraceae bacterium]